MMTSIVQQLQESALDETSSAPDLLRKAKIAAVKLGLTEAVKWIDLELNGYSGTDEEIPPYRILNGQPKAQNMYTGRWMAILFPHNNDIQDMISRIPVPDPISGLEHLLETKGDIFLPYPPSVIAILSKELNAELTQMGIFISRQAFVGILGAVRNRVLDWALQLEQIGIRGDGLSFSNREKQIAHNPHVTYQINHIGNFSGNIGSVSDHATVIGRARVTVPRDDLRELLEQIKSLKHEMGLEASKVAELEEHLAALEGELDGSEPDPNTVRRLLTSIKIVAENAAGNLISTGVVAWATRICSSLG
jgi:hypothetical protein